MPLNSRIGVFGDSKVSIPQQSGLCDYTITSITHGSHAQLTDPSSIDATAARTRLQYLVPPPLLSLYDRDTYTALVEKPYVHISHSCCENSESDSTLVVDQLGVHRCWIILVVCSCILLITLHTPLEGATNRILRQLQDTPPIPCSGTPRRSYPIFPTIS